MPIHLLRRKHTHTLPLCYRCTLLTVERSVVRGMAKTQFDLVTYLASGHSFITQYNWLTRIINNQILNYPTHRLFFPPRFQWKYANITSGLPCEHSWLYFIIIYIFLTWITKIEDNNTFVVVVYILIIILYLFTLLTYFHNGEMTCS